MLFIDLTAAFDHVPREWLFDSIRLRLSDGENQKLFEILESLYQKTSLIYEEAQTTFNVIPRGFVREAQKASLSLTCILTLL